MSRAIQDAPDAAKVSVQDMAAVERATAHSARPKSENRFSMINVGRAGSALAMPMGNPICAMSGYMAFRPMAFSNGKEKPLTTFANLQSAKSFISKITAEHELCQKLTGEYQTKSNCFNLVSHDEDFDRISSIKRYTLT